MKKISITLLMILLTSIKIFAQEEAPKVRIGIIANPGLSWLNSNKNSLKGDGVGFSFGYGLHAEFKMTKYIYFSTGLIQNNFGSKVNFKDSVNLEYTISVDGEDVTNIAQIAERTYKFNSIELPIKLKLKTPEIGYFTYFVEFGLNSNVIYKSYAKENKVYLSGSPNLVELTDDQSKLDASEETNWFRFGSIIDIGFEYNFIGNTSLLVSANWSRSFTSVLKDKPVNLSYISNGNLFSQSGNLDFATLTVGLIF